MRMCDRLQLRDKADVALDDAGLGFGRHSAEAELERHRTKVHAGALRHARVLGVLDHDETDAGGRGESLAHHAVLEDWPAIIGDSEPRGWLRAASSL